MMITTNNLMIRKHIETDWQDLYEYLSLAETYVFEPGAPITEAEAKRLTSERSNGTDFYAVILKIENKMIGHLYFHQTDPKEFLTWELGFIFNPKYQNKGFCTEASKAIVQYGFKNLNAHRIIAHCNPQNLASWKVLEKIGMEKEGFFRKKAFFHKDKNGEPLWHDCLAYGIINECEGFLDRK